LLPAVVFGDGGERARMCRSRASNVQFQKQTTQRRGCTSVNTMDSDSKHADVEVK
jgi:hypothetical protein